MPRNPPEHPVLSTRVAASAPGVDFSNLEINYLGAFNDRWKRPTLSELPNHSLYAGATGCGKTTSMKLHMSSVLPHPDPRFSMRYRSLIFDPKIDFLSFLARMGFTPSERVILTHPFDKRSTCWDLAADITSDADAQSFADIVIQDQPGQEFWQTSAKDILTSLVSGLNAHEQTRKAWDLRDVVLIAEKEKLLEQVLKRTDMGRGALRDYLKGDPRLAGSVRATVRANLAPYRIIAAMWDHSDHSFTFRKWARGAGIILIGNHYKYRDAMKRLNNLLIRYAIDTLMDRPGVVDHDRTWLFFDEIKEASKFPGFGTMLTQGRSKGIHCVLATQGLSTLQAAFPEHEAMEVVNNAGNKSIMQLGSEQDARWAEQLFSTTKRIKKSRTRPVDQANQGSVTTHEEKEPRLEARVFLELPSASNTGGAIEAYYHAPGGFYHWKRVSGDEVTYSMPPKAEHPMPDFIARPEEHFTLRRFGGDDYRHLMLSPDTDDDPEEHGPSLPFNLPPRHS